MREKQEQQADRATDDRAGLFHSSHGDLPTPAHIQIPIEVNGPRSFLRGFTSWLLL